MAAAALAYVGLGLLAVWMFPVFVAWYWARGRRRWSLALVTAACVAGGAGGQSVVIAAAFGLYACVGLAMGIALARGWSYGRVVAVSAAAAFSLFLGEVALMWDGFIASGALFRDTMLHAPGASGPTAVDTQAYLDAVARVADAWPYVMIGGTFWWMLIGACATVSAVRLLLYRLGHVRMLHGSFITMRPPDALAWAVIAVAALWFWDRQYPNDAVRLVAWNGGLALAAIYMVNGLGVLGSGVRALKPPLFLTIGAALLLLYVPYFVMFIGLFDTWSEFRVKFEKLAEAREVRKQQDDDSWF